MKKILVFLVLIFSLSFAQKGVVLTGSLENNISAVLRDTLLFSDNETFRLSIKKDYKSGGMDVEMVYNTGFTNIDPMKNFVDSSFYQAIADSLSGSMALKTAMFTTGDPVLDTLYHHVLGFVMANASSGISVDEDVMYSSYLLNDKFSINKALIKIFTAPADIYIGKQQIGWGVGYAWNPTDVFNVKNALDPKASKSGLLSLRSEINLPKDGLLSAVLIPGHVLGNISFGARVLYPIAGFDVSLSAVRMYNVDRRILGLPKKIQIGADITGDITSKSIGIWAEGCFVNQVYNGYGNFDSSYVQFVTGSNYTFGNGLFVMGEYYYNGKGSSTGDYNLTDLIFLLSGDMAGLGKHYLFGGLTKKIYNDYVEMSLFGNANIVDKSGALIPSLNYDFSDDIHFTMGAMFFIGDSNDEFGAIRNTSFIKAIVYF